MGQHKIENFSLKLTNMKSIKTEQTDEGLLLKGVPIFKSGTYRGIPYNKDYIDRNFIGQFKPEEDIPIQADHSPSFKDTLGYLKNIERKGEMVYGDMLLKDENAVSRWKKGLMKKFSLGVDMVKDKIREVSAVAFPYVRQAAVHSDTDGEKDYEIYEGTPANLKTSDDDHKMVVTTKAGGESCTVEVDGKVETLNRRPEKSDEELGLLISIEDDGSQEECCGLTEEEVDNLSKEEIIEDTDEFGEIPADNTAEFTEWSATKKTVLPDSAFLLTRRPIFDKNKDRQFPIRDSQGRISLSHVRDALARIEKLKGFSDRIKAKATTLLERLTEKAGKFWPKKKKTTHRRWNMDLRKIDFSKIEGENVELLKEACEEVIRLDGDLASKTQELSESTEKVNTLTTELKQADVDSKVDGLIQSGKITPAQKDETTKLLFSFSKEQSDGYMNLMENAKPVVDLSESGEETSEQEEEGKIKAYDIESHEANEINDFAERLAKKLEIEFQEALDLVYDSKVDEKGELIQKSE